MSEQRHKLSVWECLLLPQCKKMRPTRKRVETSCCLFSKPSKLFWLFIIVIKRNLLSYLLPHKDIITSPKLETVIKATAQMLRCKYLIPVLVHRGCNSPPVLSQAEAHTPQSHWTAHNISCLSLSALGHRCWLFFFLKLLQFFGIGDHFKISNQSLSATKVYKALL